jgi:hypothetical protein
VPIAPLGSDITELLHRGSKSSNLVSAHEAVDAEAIGTSSPGRAALRHLVGCRILARGGRSTDVRWLLALSVLAAVFGAGSIAVAQRAVRRNADL